MPLTDEQKERYAAKAREKRAAQTDEKKQEMSLRAIERRKKRIAAMDEEELRGYNAKIAGQQRGLRANHTREQKDAINASYRKWVHARPPEAKAETAAKATVRARKWRRNMSPASRRRYNAYQAERGRKFLAKMTLEERMAHWNEQREKKREKLRQMRKEEREREEEDEELMDHSGRRKEERFSATEFTRRKLDAMTPAQKKNYMARVHEIGAQRILARSKKEREEVEQKTRPGHAGRFWKEERIGVVTGTKMYAVVANLTADLRVLRDRMVCAGGDGGGPRTLAMTLGILLEKTAVHSYMRRIGVKPGNYQHPVGLTINPDLSFVGATPDSIIRRNGRLVVCEFKFSLRPVHSGKSYLQKPSAGKGGKWIPPLKSSSSSSSSSTRKSLPHFTMRRRTGYFYQLVTQMICTDADEGRLIVYHDSDPDPDQWEMWAEMITKKEAKNLWEEVMLPKVLRFYAKYFLDEEGEEKLKKLLAKLERKKKESERDESDSEEENEDDDDDDDDPFSDEDADILDAIYAWEMEVGVEQQEEEEEGGEK